MGREESVPPGDDRMYVELVAALPTIAPFGTNVLKTQNMDRIHSLKTPDSLQKCVSPLYRPPRLQSPTTS